MLCFLWLATEPVVVIAGIRSSGGLLDSTQPLSITMNTQNMKISDLGKRRIETTRSRNNSARCGNCETAGSFSPSTSYCHYIGARNVRSLYHQGELACILQEMEKLNLDILGVSETFWPDAGEFQSSIPTSEENYKVIYSGGKKHRKEVGLIMNRKTENSVIYY